MVLSSQLLFKKSIKPFSKIFTYFHTNSGTALDRIATQSMSNICNLWHLIVIDCDNAESYGRFLSGGNSDASHAVYIVPDDN